MTELTLEFRWRYQSYEIKAVPQRLARLTPDEPNVTIELLKWDVDSQGKEFCFTLAYFVKDDEGYDLKFVGDRPFEYIDQFDLPAVWEALQSAQKTLDAWFYIADRMEKE